MLRITKPTNFPSSTLILLIESSMTMFDLVTARSTADRRQPRVFFWLTVSIDTSTDQFIKTIHTSTNQLPNNQTSPALIELLDLSKHHVILPGFIPFKHQYIPPTNCSSSHPCNPTPHPFHHIRVNNATKQSCCLLTIKSPLYAWSLLPTKLGSSITIA